MIVNFFNRTKPINLVFLSILLFLFYILAVFLHYNGDFSTSIFVKNGINLFLIFGSFLVYNFIVSKNNLSKETDLGILFYVLLFGVFSILFITNKFIIAHFFLLFSFRRLYSLRSEIHPKQKLFDSGFWIGIATIFYPLSILFMIINIIAIFAFNKVSWRHFLIPIIGFVTPVFILFSYLFYIDNLSIFIKTMHINTNLSIRIYSATNFLIPMLFVGFMGLLSFFYVSRKFGQENMNFKSSWTLHFVQCIVALIIIALEPNKNGGEWIFLFFPLSLFFANYLSLIQRKWIREIILLLFFVLIIGAKFL